MMRTAINKLSGKPIEMQQMFEIGRNDSKDTVESVLLVSVSFVSCRESPDKT